MLHDDPKSIEGLYAHTFDELREIFVYISPSYALATEIRASDLSAAERQRRIRAHYASGVAKSSDVTTTKAFNFDAAQAFDDFQTVLRFHDDFQELQKNDHFLFQLGGDSDSRKATLWFTSKYLLDRLPISNPIAYVNPREGSDIEQFDNDMCRFLVSAKAPNAWPESLVVALPLAVPCNELLKMVANLVDSYADQGLTYTGRADVTFLGKRLHFEPLYAKLRLLLYKIFYPDEQLWKLGIRARISKTYVRLFNSPQSKGKLSSIEKERLSIITSRALSNAKLIAENAARGVFPSTKAVYMPKYDWCELRKRLTDRWPSLK